MRCVVLSSTIGMDVGEDEREHRSFACSRELHRDSAPLT